MDNNSGWKTMKKEEILGELSKKLDECEVQSQALNTGHPYAIGEAYLFRLVTFFWIGRVQAVTDQEIVIKEASWIPDTGRYHEALEKGLDGGISGDPECEPVQGAVVLGRGALIDAVPYPHALPRKAM